MNEDRNTKVLFATVYIGIPALYFLWRLTPYLLFYVTPFVLFSLLLAAIWTVVVQVAQEDYSWLGLAIPITAILVFLLVGFPKVYVVTDKLSGIPIDGTFFYNAFNGVKAWFDLALWSIIPDGFGFFAPKVPVPKALYDLNDVRGILWASLGIGAPVVFHAIASQKVGAIKTALEVKYQQVAKDNEAQLDSVRAEKHRALRAAEIDKRHVEEQRDYFREEHAKLKTLMEFQKKAAGATNQDGEPNTKKGVLDSEDL